MGVPGLFRYLTENRDTFSSTVELSTGGTMLVDGHGLFIELIHLTVHGDSPLRAQFDKNQVEPCRDADLFGADLLPLQDAVKQLVKVLKEEYKIKLVILLENDFCGATTDIQRQLCKQHDEGKEERFQDRQKRKGRLIAYCAARNTWDGPRPDYFKWGKRHTFIPPLSIDAARKSFEMCGATVININGEVDACVRNYFDEADNCLCVLTNDVSLALVPGLPVVHTDDFPITSILSLKSRPNKLAVRCYSCRHICEQLGCTAEHVAMAAAVTTRDEGRQFTDMLEKVQFDELKAEAIRADPAQMAIVQRFTGLSKVVTESQQGIPKGLLTLAAGGYTWDTEVNGQYLLDVPTFRRLLTIAAALLGRQQVTVKRHAIQHRDPAKSRRASQLSVPVQRSVLPLGEDWRQLEDPAQLRVYLATTLLPNGDTWEPMPSWGEFWSPEDQLLAIAVLRTASAGLDARSQGDEIRTLVAMVTLSSALACPELNAAASGIVQAMLSCAEDYISTHPQVRPKCRLLELSCIFAEAYTAVSDVFELVGCGDTRQPTRWSFLNAAAAQSGTVLYAAYILTRLIGEGRVLLSKLKNHPKGDLEWGRQQTRMEELMKYVMA